MESKSTGTNRRVSDDGMTCFGLRRRLYGRVKGELSNVGLQCYLCNVVLIITGHSHDIKHMWKSMSEVAVRACPERLFVRAYTPI